MDQFLHGVFTRLVEARPHQHAWPPRFVKTMLNNSMTLQQSGYSLRLYGYRFEVNQMPHLLLIIEVTTYHGCMIYVCRALKVKVSCREVPNQHAWATIFVQDGFSLILILY